MSYTKQLVSEEQDNQPISSRINPFSLIKSREIGGNIEPYLRGYKSRGYKSNKKFDFYRDILLLNNGVRARDKSRLIHITESERAFLRKRALDLFAEGYQLGSTQAYHAFYSFVGQLAYNGSKIPENSEYFIKVGSGNTFDNQTYEIFRDLLRNYSLNHIMFTEHITVLHRIMTDNPKLLIKLIIDNPDLKKKFKSYIISNSGDTNYNVLLFDIIEIIEGLPLKSITYEYIKAMLVRWKNDIM